MKTFIQLDPGPAKSRRSSVPREEGTRKSQSKNSWCSHSKAWLCPHIQARTQANMTQPPGPDMDITPEPPIWDSSDPGSVCATVGDSTIITDAPDMLGSMIVRCPPVGRIFHWRQKLGNALFHRDEWSWTLKSQPLFQLSSRTDRGIAQLGDTNDWILTRWPKHNFKFLFFRFAVSSRRSSRDEISLWRHTK